MADGSEVLLTTICMSRPCRKMRKVDNFSLA